MRLPKKENRGGNGQALNFDEQFIHFCRRFPGGSRLCVGDGGTSAFLQTGQYPVAIPDGRAEMLCQSLCGNQIRFDGPSRVWFSSTKKLPLERSASFIAISACDFAIGISLPIPGMIAPFAFNKPMKVAMALVIAATGGTVAGIAGGFIFRGKYGRPQATIRTAKVEAAGEEQVPNSRT